MSDSYRDPEDTTRMHNSPRYGPIKSLRLVWKRLFGTDSDH